jgi:exonuclease III
MAESSAKADDKLHIISWNVASWTTTLKEIRAQHGSFKAWADKHHVGILCLQEVKSSVARLEKEPTAFAAQEPGFDAFFSLCRTTAVTGNSSSSKVGFNGVATFARRGMTVAANSRPLGVPDLDNQGRCLETDHGDFLLYNIYAPYDGYNSDGLALKMRFLIAVRETMRRRRAQTGKPVILAGDFNARYRALDSSREMRTLDIPKLLTSPPLPGEPPITQDLRRVLSQGLAKAKASLTKLELQPFGDKGKFRVFARHPLTNELKRMNPETTWSKEHADVHDPFGSFIVDANMSLKEAGGFADFVHSSGHRISEISERDGDVRWVGHMEDCACLYDVRIITRELLDLNWTDESFNAFADFEKGGWILAGKLCTSAWMECLLGEDGMVDTFAHVHPSAEGRYTVWCQQTNDRFSNLGSRIDYILVDSRVGSLRIAPDSIPLYGCQCRTREECVAAQFKCADGEQCARNACTAYGRWRPAPFAGGGLPQGTAADYETQFLREPHTGIIYTPPQFSDHVATSCVLQGISPSLLKRELQIAKDAETMATRPFAKQSSIASFFTMGSKRQKSEGDLAGEPSTK